MKHGEVFQRIGGRAEWTGWGAVLPKKRDNVIARVLACLRVQVLVNYSTERGGHLFFFVPKWASVLYVLSSGLGVLAKEVACVFFPPPFVAGVFESFGPRGGVLFISSAMS